MTRDEELNLIENAIQNGKLKRITLQESLNHDLNNQKLASETSSKRMKRVNNLRIGTRDTSKSRRI